MDQNKITGLVISGFVLGLIGWWRSKTPEEVERFRAKVSWPFWLIGIGRPTQQEREWARVGRKRGEDAPAVAHSKAGQGAAIERSTRDISAGE